MNLFRKFRVSVAQFLLLVALIAIGAWGWVVPWPSSRTPEYWVSAVAFSPNGQTLAASLYVCHSVQLYTPDPKVGGADASQSFLLLSLPELKREKLFERSKRDGILGPFSVVREMGLGQSLDFSPDGKMLATKGLDNRVSIWNVGSGKKIRDLSAADYLSGAVSWANNGTLAIAAANACYVLPANATALQRITGPRDSVAVAISGDGNKLATANNWQETIELWDTHSGVRLQYLDSHCLFGKPALAISADDNLVAGGTFRVENNLGHPVIRLWDAASGKERTTWDLKSHVLAIAFSPDATALAVGCWGKLHILSLVGGKDYEIPVSGGIATVAFSPDGKLLATGDSQGTISLWNARTRTLLCETKLQPPLSLPVWLGVVVAAVIWVAVWILVTRRQKVALAKQHAVGPFAAHSSRGT